LEKPLTYTNPSSIRSVGDPFVLKAPDGAYYCYPTSGPGFKVWKSENLIEWRYLGSVYDSAQDGAWVDSKFWAPEVVYHEGNYYMYYSGNWADKDSLRIGLAIAKKPEGPFIEALKKPFFDFGYAAIDAHVFIDDNGEKYFYYSRDCSENLVNGIYESHIYGARLADSMMELADEPVLLTRPDQEWEKRSGRERRWNEGAHLIKHDNKYYLMYSANFYGGKFYGLGYAVSDHPLGPFEKNMDNPVLEIQSDWKHISGPGHHSIFMSPDDTEIWIAYHTHMTPEKGGGSRQMAIDRMGFKKHGALYINGPSLSPMPLPSGIGEIKNIAPQARTAVSSGSDRQDALTDGEIGFNKRFGHHDWVADEEDTSPEIILNWERPMKISSVMVYRGSPYSGSSFEVSVKVNQKSGAWQNFPPTPGAALIFEMDGIKTSACTI